MSERATTLRVPKEIGAAILFVAAGSAGLALAPSGSTTTLPSALFYAVLVVNTYFSIRFFSNLPPVERDETAVDGALVALYLALALAIGHPVPFTAIATALFGVGILKYLRLRAVIGFPKTLRRKIGIDSQGTALSAAALLGAASGYDEASVWVLSVVLSLANLHLLLVDPMYRSLD